MFKKRDTSRFSIIRTLFPTAAAAFLLASGWSTSAWTETLTFTPPNVATPGSVTLLNGNVGYSTTFTLWSTDTNLVNSVLRAQGYTPANNWTTDSITMGNTTNFNVVNDGGGFIGYLLQSSGGNPSSNNALDESMHTTLNIGNTIPPVAKEGQTVTEHWLQLLHEDRPYPLPVPGPNNFGFTIAGQQGFWQVDNSDKNGTGAGSSGTSPTPFYDLAFPGWTATEIGDDPTVLSDGKKGAYLQFYDIPVWDIQSVNSDVIALGTTGFTWGFVVPEPASLTLLLLSAPFLLRRRAARSWQHRNCVVLPRRDGTGSTRRDKDESN